MWSKILVPVLYKIAIPRKPKLFSTFCLFFLDCMVLWQFHQNIQKNHLKKKSAINSKCSQFQAKHSVIIQENKEWE